MLRARSGRRSLLRTGGRTHTRTHARGVRILPLRQLTVVVENINMDRFSPEAAIPVAGLDGGQTVRPPSTLPRPLLTPPESGLQPRIAPLATPEICINDVALDESDCDGIGAGGVNGTGDLLAPPGDGVENDGVGGSDDPSSLDIVKKQWRRSSWCPEEERKKEEKHEKQRMILAVVGKR